MHTPKLNDEEITLPIYEEPFDMRPYIFALVRGWYWIVGGAVLSAVTTLGFAYILPDQYEATSGVVILRERTDFSFSESLRTEETLSIGAGARQMALVALVTNNIVAAQALETARESLDPAKHAFLPEGTPVSIMNEAGFITVENEGDLIEITLRNQDPQVAALLANAWAQAYVDYVNQLFIGSSGSLEILPARIDVAFQEYEAAQTALEEFLSRNQIDSLESEIEFQEALIASYLANQTEIVTNAQGAQNDVLEGYYEKLRNLNYWLADAKALRNQVLASNGDTAENTGNALSLISLQLRTFGNDGIINIDLSGQEFDAVTSADIENLIAVLEAQITIIQAEIDALLLSLQSKGVSSADEFVDVGAIESAQQNLSQLRSRLAREQARFDELTTVRDLKWETYQALIQNQQEIQVEGGSEVRLAGNADIPDRPAGNNRLQLAVLTGLIGMFAVVGLLLGRVWWLDLVEESPENEPAEIMKDARAGINS
jgi:uncharacterized protein involved in exopolysaccharide biosynthesis